MHERFIHQQRALARFLNALAGQPPAAPARNCDDVLNKFVFSSREATAEFGRKSDDDKKIFALTEAANALTEIGMDSGESTVKKFLNRIAGLDVARQNLVFSLFMATLDDVIADAKATGEFEGSVEDIRASRVTLKEKPREIAIDTSCGATTTLTRLIVDRGVSFDSIIETIIEENSRGEEIEGEQSALDVDADDHEKQCKSGFYLSKRKIAGRHLILYAQRKTEKKASNDSKFIDPLNLMIITRPNTGKNPCEMSSDDLRYKYKLLASVEHITTYLHSKAAHDELSDEEEKSETDVSLPQIKDILIAIREKWGISIADLWDDAYDNSNYKDHHDGLAPRISEIGLITGAVLHILPSLEKAVQFMSQGQRALRVMRAELSDSREKIVGIKFPVTEEAIERLMVGMKVVEEARKGSLDAPSFIDEACAPVDQKVKNWATAERKTMKSFFGAKAPASKSSTGTIRSLGGSSLDEVKRKDFGSSATTPSLSSKKQKSNSSGSTKKSSSGSLTSFFGKKNSP